MSVTVFNCDVFEGLSRLDDDSIDCVVTSPPYWGLRDYGVEGQIGLEPTLAEHLETMVRVFEEVKRVLKPEGSLWLNYGDCYATTPNGWSAAKYKADGNDDRTFRDKPFSTIGGVLKPKDLCMIPNRLAIALQEAGWWVRSEIIWAKPNPMPESVSDRPATAHEKIWLLTKSGKYYYDLDAVTQECSKNTHARLAQDIEKQIGSARANGGAKTNGNMKAVARKHKNLEREKPHTMHKARVKDNDSFDSALAVRPTRRNLRNYEPAPVQVWRMNTASFSDAHFATFPAELVERCLKAGCPEGGLVLDPFAGAGTTGLVADRLNRKSTLIEISPEYVEIARRRIESNAGMFSKVEVAA